jgi:hypothetical protein
MSRDSTGANRGNGDENEATDVERILPAEYAEYAEKTES